jgi:peroxiredoxin Q/BCP
LADYRDHYAQLRAAGASVVAVSVDPPEESEALRIQLSLPFPILCDTQRQLVREWHIYNPRERGGIAKPAVFIIDAGGVVQYAAVDNVTTRVPAAEIVRLLQTSEEMPSLRRKLYIPLFSDWLRALRNQFHR